MKTYPVPESIKKAKLGLGRAQKALLRAIKKEYPVGTVILADLGGNLLKLKVEAHHALGIYQDYINARNLKTGKLRRARVNGEWDNIEVLLKPAT